MHCFRNQVVFFILAVVGLTVVSAQSIISSLAKYTKTFSTSVSGLSVSSFSGVAFHPAAKTLYVVDDAATEVYEIDTAGNVLRTITLSGFDDTEGIAYQSGMFFFITEEREANVVRALLPQTGSGTVDYDDCSVLSIGENWGNSGLEDVTYCTSTNTAYAVKELSPPRLYKVTLDADGIPIDFTENEPFNIENNTGDAAGLFALPDSTLLLLSQEDNKLFGYTGTGNMLSELSLDMNKPEGVTVDLSDSTIYVVGEPRDFYVFKKPGTAIQKSSARKEPFTVFSTRYCGNKSNICFTYTMSSRSSVVIEIVTPLGKKINTLVNEIKDAGIHHVFWYTRLYPSGVYIITFETGLYTKSLCMTML